MTNNVLISPEQGEVDAFGLGLAAVPVSALSLPRIDTKGLLDQLLANPQLLLLLLSMLKGATGGGTGKPGELPPPVVPPAPPADEDTGKVEPPEEDEPAGQFIDSFENTHLVDVLERGQAKARNSDAIKAGTSTQAVGQRARLDTSPSFRGRKYPGNDPVMNGPTAYGRDGKPNAPRVQWRWTVDGKIASNSEEMTDPFHLGSYEDNGGTTPSFRLEEPAGPGRHEVRAWPFIEAKDNGGVEVSGEAGAARWFID